MNLLVISDAHIIKTKDGSFWCDTNVHGYEFWSRYIQIFDEVHVMSRVRLEENIDTSRLIRANGKNVKIIELPFVRGFSGYIKNFFSFTKAVKRSIGDEEAAVFRLPSLPSFIMLHYYKKLKRPYAFEIVADPEDCYKGNKLAQKLFIKLTKKECLKANGVSYVTHYYLENKYPSNSIINGESNKYFDTYYSSINLDKSFLGKERDYSSLKKIRIVHVASSINADLKGHTTLINIAEQLNNIGVDFSVNCLGQGIAVPYYKEMVHNKGLDGKVNFLGVFSKKEDLKNLLMESDLFVFPTQAEGLPRAIIEAMAVGLPCLSTPVNGIPELLDSEYLFDPFDVDGFTQKVVELINNPNEMNQMSHRNIDKSKEYIKEVLTDRRNIFYGKLKACVIGEKTRKEGL